jgi:hypothetical protein
MSIDNDCLTMEWSLLLSAYHCALSGVRMLAAPAVGVFTASTAPQKQITQHPCSFGQHQTLMQTQMRQHEPYTVSVARFLLPEYLRLTPVESASKVPA